MSGLLVPDHVHRARVAAKTRQMSVANSVATFAGNSAPNRSIQDEISAPIPEGVPKAPFYRLIVMPIGIRQRTKGGLLLTDSTEVAQSYNHGLCKVVSIGSQAFKGPTYEGCDPSELPKINTLVLINPKAAGRVTHNGQLYLIVNDDAVQAIVSPEHAEGYTFVDGIEI